jgi:hypothetical protein
MPIAALAALLVALPGFAQAGINPIVVPEPTTLGLIAAGIAGLAIARRRRK